MCHFVQLVQINVLEVFNKKTQKWKRFLQTNGECFSRILNFGHTFSGIVCIERVSFVISKVLIKNFGTLQK